MEWLGIVFVAAVAGWLFLILAGSRPKETARSEIRLASVERKLDAVMNHLGVSEEPPEEPDVVRHLERGERIQAIKAYRERTGLGLAAAKDEVDRIARERGLGR